MLFDHLWVSGLTDEAWPRRASPNPFLPVAAQRAAGMDEASAEGSLARDRRITEGWLVSADEVVFSCFEKEDDRALAPSPLILGVENKAVDVPAFPDLRQLIFASRKLQSAEDSVGPALTALQVRGGTKILSDQSACPFRAFAHHRLRAEKLEAPPEGLDASDRGKLLHALMASVWTQIRTSKDLEKDLSSVIEEAASIAVKELKLEGRFAELERARLVRLAREWFDQVERKRPPFEVVSVEEQRKIKAGPLELDARIDRMDKIQGGYVLIDYKTGKPTPAKWKTPRPDEPQVPLYAVSAKEDISAVAFGKLMPGGMRLMGFSRDAKALPSVKKYDEWKKLFDDWRGEIDSLATAFAAGEARVDPKNELQTCRYCDLQTLCRVYEKVNPLRLDEIEGADE
jgi:probable DNA repair protein